jgi:cell migration-inducing and hyaluronan-binding protein
VFGGLDMHGIPKAITWTELAATANAGDTELTLADSVDWSAGDEIIIAPTSFEWLEAEKAVIQAVSGNTITLTAPLQYMHYCEYTSEAAIM